MRGKSVSGAACGAVLLSVSAPHAERGLPMLNADDSNVLVFFLLGIEPGVGVRPADFFAADVPELCVDEQTPRFVCQHLRASELVVAEPLMLKVCEKSSFVHGPLAELDACAEGTLRVELQLLHKWLQQNPQPTVAYQWKLGAYAAEVWRRPDDIVTYWEDLSGERRRALRDSGAAAPYIYDWVERGQALAASEDDVFAELLGATADNLPLYEYVFRMIATERLLLSGSTELLRYRICDRVVKMFIRFPTYMSRQFLRRDHDRDGMVRATYLHLLATAFRYKVAPLSLDRFCDYLSAKADCHGQERADLAWFVGELSILGRPHTPIGLGAEYGGWLTSDVANLL